MSQSSVCQVNENTGGGLKQADGLKRAQREKVNGWDTMFLSEDKRKLWAADVVHSEEEEAGEDGESRAECGHAGFFDILMKSQSCRTGVAEWPSKGAPRFR